MSQQNAPQTGPLNRPVDERAFNHAVNLPTLPARVPGILLFLLVPFILGLGIAISCYIASGVSLGLFFGPVLLITFAASPLALRGAPNKRLLTCVALTFGIWIFWLLAAHLSAMNLLRCGLVLFSYITALAGGAALIERLRIGPVFASAIMVLLGTAWLTWPVWLCTWLDGPHAEAVVHGLTAIHPLMAINGVLFERFNFWDRYTIAYQQLTSLNQDIFYALPRTIMWMVLVHLSIGAGALIRSR